MNLPLKPRSYSLIIMVFWLVACKKWLEPAVSDTVITSNRVLTNDSLALAACNGLLKSIVQNYGPLNGNMTKYGGLLADELQRTATQPHPSDDPFAMNNLAPEGEVIKQTWRITYNYIYAANELISGLAANNSVSPGVRELVLGECHFIRALAYLHMVCLFGDVPLVLHTDLVTNAKISRTPGSKVYEQIIQDLRMAEQLLPEDYRPYAGYAQSRICANKSAARALLARACLYAGRWADAAAAASLVIQHPLYVLEGDVKDVFLSESKEAILQLPPYEGNYNSAEGSLFVPGSPASRPPFALTKELMGTFEPGDKRRAWVRSMAVGGNNYNSPYKYRVNGKAATTELTTVLRLAEVYLIRAEARLQLNRLPEAVSDLNRVRARAGLSAIQDIVNREIVQAALENERRIELQNEGGHRWLDLIRWPSQQNPNDSLWRRADDVLAVIKPDWQLMDKRWPIPQSELQLNPNLKQNPGY